MNVLGVDPGLSGAFAVYDADARRLVEIFDMPTYAVTVNRGVRKKIDPITLYDWLALQKMLGCALVLIEQVGGRPKQAAGAAFNFGYGVGLLYASCVALRVPVETVVPGTWKKAMRVPGKAGDDPKKAAGDIVGRADEMFPDQRAQFRGPKGGLLLDRAEAAMLAKYAGDYALRSIEPGAEWRLSKQVEDLP